MLWAFALIAAVIPLWSTRTLPLVDLPQHLHLISVLERLDDPSTLYPEVFARRPELTPYLGYYYTVRVLALLMPLELANRLFLSAYVMGVALALAFLLRSLGRPTYPALLALPFAYGDSFYWGFINYCTAQPLSLMTCGLFVRAITDAPRRRRWASWLAGSLSLVLLFHVQAFAYLAVALPFLLFTTPAPEGRTPKARLAALLGVVPGVLLFVIWVGLRMGQPQEIAPGQPWKSWGPMLSEQNLAFKPFDQNLADLVDTRELSFPVLAGALHDGSDQWAVRLALLAALLLTLAALAQRVPGLSRASESARAQGEGPVARFRMLGLFAIAIALFFTLPFDIRGYMYYLNTRYAHLSAMLLVGAVPVLKSSWSRWGALVGPLCACVLAVPLSRGFAAFDREVAPLRTLISASEAKPRVMGLIYRSGSHVVRYPVHLHAACALARAQGGLTNFSFALTPHSPLMYRGAAPPTFPSEWRPNEMQWETQGRYYDHFVVRGRHPQEIFGGRLGQELYIAAEEADFYLVRKR